MTYSELLPAAEALPRIERLQLMQALLRSIARDEGVPLLDPNGAYEVGSLYDAYEGAEILQKFINSGAGNQP